MYTLILPEYICLYFPGRVTSPDFAGGNALPGYQTHGSDDTAGVDPGTLQEHGPLANPHVISHEDTLGGIDPLLAIDVIDEMGVGIAHTDLLGEKASTADEHMLLLREDHANRIIHVIITAKVDHTVVIDIDIQLISMLAPTKIDQGVAAEK